MARLQRTEPTITDSRRRVGASIEAGKLRDHLVDTFMVLWLGKGLLLV